MFKFKGGIIINLIRLCAILFFVVVIAIVAFLYFFRGGSGYSSTSSGKAFSEKGKPSYVNENLKKQDKKDPKGLNVEEISADDLFRVFNENEYAFNNQYKGKYYKIIGFADKVIADDENIPHIELYGGIMQTVDITLVKSIEHLAADIRKGDSVSVIGVIESGETSFFINKRIFIKNAVFSSPVSNETKSESKTEEK